MNKTIKSFIEVLSSNIYNLLIGIILGFIAPKILGPLEYGFWALFALYLSYAGILVFGVSDGLYLNYGGFLYKDLDYKKIRSCYFFTSVYLIIVMIIFNIIIGFLNFDNNYLLLFRLLSFASVLTCLNGLLILINQATARFKIYSIANILPKTLIALSVVFLVFFNKKSFVLIVIGNIVGLIITNLFLVIKSKELVIGKLEFGRNIISEIVFNIKAGLPLTITGIASMLMMGFGKFLIESKLGVTALGYYSFAFSLITIFTQVIYAISTIIYPLVKRKPRDIEKIFSIIDYAIVYLSGLILLLYFPCRYLLGILFTNYSNSFGCLLYLFPIVICDARIILTFSSKYKIERKERLLLKVLLISISFCIFTTVILFSLFNTIEIVAFSTYIGFVFWQTILSIKDGSFKITLDYLFEILYFICYLMFGWSLHCFIITIIVFIIVYIVIRKEIKSKLQLLLKYIRGGSNEKR